MEAARADRLDLPVDPERDHVLGPEDAQITLVEYGSYVCAYCHTAHQVVRQLRDHFGDRMRYVYRHLPLADRREATLAAELAEYAARTTGDFWTAHDLLMRHGPTFEEGELDRLADELGIPPRAQWDPATADAAVSKVRADARSGLRSGARVTPTFFINGRRYEGAWDEASLSEAMLRSLGHRIHSASLDFVRWGPSTGLLLVVMTLLAVVLSNTSLGPGFLQLWETPLGIEVGSGEFALSIIDWVNHGLLTVFFLVVGLEIKRELTVGRLGSPAAAALPIAAATGGMVAPALLFLTMAPAQYHHSWGMTITTDTAFSVALIVLLGQRVPVDLRVFLTAAVIADDLVAIALVALVYSTALQLNWLAAAVVVSLVLAALGRWRVYRPLPYAVLGVVLWFALHEAGLHATLAGVILAIVTPTRPPPNLQGLLAQAQAVIAAERRDRGDAVMRTGPSEAALRAIDAIHDRIESPASKLLRVVEPWSSYAVLPLFALVNAGVTVSAGMLAERERLVLSIAIALVGGKLIGILGGARIAVALGIAAKPDTYGWRQVAGAGALAGIGFTMSLFIARHSLAGPDYDAAKVGIFLASIVAGLLGAALLWKPPATESRSGRAAKAAEVTETGTPIGPAYQEVA